MFIPKKATIECTNLQIINNINYYFIAIGFVVFVCKRSSINYLEKKIEGGKDSKGIYLQFVWWDESEMGWKVSVLRGVEYDAGGGCCTRRQG